MGEIVWSFRGADNEVGRLRSVIVHRPGAELKRITPRSCGTLLFGRVPWVSRAQQEHDAFAQALRDAGVEVLYLTELLQDAMEYVPARQQAVDSVLADARLGDELRGQLSQHLDGLDPETLSQVLIAGLTRADFRTGRGAVYQLLSPHDFVIDPLPNLLFTRDSSVWLGDNVAVASLAPGVIAVGTGGHTTAAALERLARRVFDAGFAHTVLAVPIEPRPAPVPSGAASGATAHRGAAYGGPVHLDTICTMVDTDAAVMHPALAYTLTARSISPRADGLRVSHPQPFLEAAALAMGIDRLRVIDTGLDPATAGCAQWDDGGNTLALGPRLAVSFERNVETNARLEAAGIEVIRVPGSELASDRGGPRGMSCRVSRDRVSTPDHGT